MSRRIRPLLTGPALVLALSACGNNDVVVTPTVEEAKVVLVDSGGQLRLSDAPMKAGYTAIYPNPKRHTWLAAELTSDARLVISCKTPGAAVPCSDSPFYVRLQKTSAGKKVRLFDINSHVLAELDYTGNRCDPSESGQDSPEAPDDVFDEGGGAGDDADESGGSEDGGSSGGSDDDGGSSGGHDDEGGLDENGSSGSTSSGGSTSGAGTGGSSGTPANGSGAGAGGDQGGASSGGGEIFVETSGTGAAAASTDPEVAVYIQESGDVTSASRGLTEIGQIAPACPGQGSTGTPNPEMPAGGGSGNSGDDSDSGDNDDNDGTGICSPEAKARFCEVIQEGLVEFGIPLTYNCANLDKAQSFPRPDLDGRISCESEIVSPAGDALEDEFPSCDRELVRVWENRAVAEIRHTGYCGGSPLVLDLDGNGIQIRPIEAGTRFDLFGTGQRLKTAWITGGDALLVMDRDGDGRIKDGTELFGTVTADASFSDGFEALNSLDENGDGRVDASDSSFGKLQAWVDADGDGAASRLELKSLSAVGVKSLATLAQKITGLASTDRNGTWIPLVASFERFDGTSGKMADVYFRYEPAMDALACR